MDKPPKAYGACGKRKPPRRVTKNKQEVRLLEMKLRAEAKFKDKWATSAKGLKAKLIGHIEALIDKINPLEMAATLGLTYYVYNHMPPIIAKVLGIQEHEIKNQLAQFSLSLSISYIMVHHFGAMVQAGASIVKSISDLATWFIIGGAISAPGVSTTVPFAIGKFWGLSTSLITLVPYPIVQDAPANTAETGDVWGSLLNWFFNRASYFRAPS